MIKTVIPTAKSIMRKIRETENPTQAQFK